jgi:hypothetical protein
MNDQISCLSKERAAAQKIAEERQRAAHVSEERANAAEAAQRAVMVPLFLTRRLIDHRKKLRKRGKLRSTTLSSIGTSSLPLSL